jgi:prepilin-type processing-associated H-X9-DG protein
MYYGLCNTPVYRINGTRAFAFSSRHTGGAQFLFCDGSVHFLGDSLDGVTYERLGQRNDSQVIGEF